MADAAYRFDSDSNRWVTSSYYEETVPSWVQEINATRSHLRVVQLNGDRCEARRQTAVQYGRGSVGYALCGALEATPWGNEIIEEFAEPRSRGREDGSPRGDRRAGSELFLERLRGHAPGPSTEERDISIRMDRLPGQLLEAVDKRLGLNNAMPCLKLMPRKRRPRLCVNCRTSSVFTRPPKCEPVSSGAIR
jgi:hypothetical protein